MDLLADLRFAVRLLRKTPVFTVAAIGTRPLGIGAGVGSRTFLAANRPIP